MKMIKLLNFVLCNGLTMSIKVDFLTQSDSIQLASALASSLGARKFYKDNLIHESSLKEL